MIRVIRKWIGWARIEPVGVAMPGPRLPKRIRSIIEVRSYMRISRTRAACTVASCAVICVALLAVTLTRAQSPDTGADWEKAAGGKMAFEVASIKPNLAPFSLSNAHFNIAIEPDGFDDFTPSGGLFEATDWPLWGYVAFAYKLSFYQAQVLRSEAPKWVVDDRFDIQARAAGNPTKDQYRLMVQTLLAERLKMTARFETRQGPIYALVLAKPGRTGPLLQPFPDGFPCSSTVPRGGRGQPGQSPASSGPATGTVGDGQFPAYCGLLRGGFVPMTSSEPGVPRLGARNVSWEQILQNLLIMGGQLRVFDRLVSDRTGLSGQFDIAFEWSPRPLNAAPSDDETGPTFTEALRDQLGLKLESTTGPAQVLVIDHIEEPTAN